MSKFKENVFKYNFTEDYKVCREEINKSIAQTTNLEFQDFLAMNDVHADTNFLAISVAYFSGKFVGTFEKTENVLFKGLEREGYVPMMKLSGMFKIGEIHFSLTLFKLFCQGKVSYDKNVFHLRE